MENSLSRMRPHLVSEWSEKNFPLTPDTITTVMDAIMEEKPIMEMPVRTN